MSVHDPGYRPSGWGTAGDHESRIRKLEAVRFSGIWVGDDCCLHWICPADGQEYFLCGNPVPTPMVEADISFVWGDYDTAWIGVTGSIPSIVDSAGSPVPFTLDGTNTELDCVTAATYHIVFDGDISQGPGEGATTDIWLVNTNTGPGLILKILDGVLLTNGYTDTLHVEGDWTFSATEAIYLLGRHVQVDPDDPDPNETTLTGTLTLTKTS